MLVHFRIHRHEPARFDQTTASGFPALECNISGGSRIFAKVSNRADSLARGASSMEEQARSVKDAAAGLKTRVLVDVQRTRERIRSMRPKESETAWISATATDLLDQIKGKNPGHLKTMLDTIGLGARVKASAVASAKQLFEKEARAIANEVLDEAHATAHHWDLAEAETQMEVQEAVEEASKSSNNESAQEALSSGLERQIDTMYEDMSKAKRMDKSIDDFVLRYGTDAVRAATNRTLSTAVGFSTKEIGKVEAAFEDLKSAFSHEAEHVVAKYLPTLPEVQSELKLDATTIDRAQIRRFTPSKFFKEDDEQTNHRATSRQNCVEISEIS